MKILLITPTEPTDRSFGGALRTSDLAFALAKFGQLHTLVIQGALSTHVDEHLSTAGQRSATYSVRGGALKRLWHRLVARQKIAALIDAEHYDVIVARYVGQAIFVPWSSWSRLVIDPDDVYKSVEPNTGLEKRMKVWLRNSAVAWLLRRASHVWIVNPKDTIKLGIKKASLISNVTHVPEVCARITVQPQRILMVGYFRYEPNVVGLRWFVAEVLPILIKSFPDIELHAVGKFSVGLDEEFGKNVKVRGYVEDIKAEYQRADLVIAPITSGGGSQIKVIEALAHCRPLVASRFAWIAFSEQLVPDEHLMIANNINEWHAACLCLLQTPSMAEEMGLRGQSVVRSQYGMKSMLSGVGSTLAKYGASSRL